MNHTTLRFSRRAGEHRPCDAHAAIALQKFTKPATRRFFYACALAAALAGALLLSGCDDLQAAHAQAVEQLADQQDREALSSREWAGQQVCGPHATAVWLDDKTLECLRHRTQVKGAGQ